MIVKMVFLCTVLLMLIACVEASPAQQTETAYMEQTKVVEQATKEYEEKLEKEYKEQTKVAVQATKEIEDKIDDLQSGFDKEEIIAGEHCEKAGYGGRFVTAVQERIGDDVGFRLHYDPLFDGYMIYSLPAMDILEFDIPIPDEFVDTPNELFAPQNRRINVPIYPQYRTPEYTNDRPQHEARMVYTTFDGMFEAIAFVDHWTCDVQILRIGLN